MDFTSLRFHEVSQVFGRRRALNRVSLVAAAGTVTALLGHNGAGKSTLLSIAATLLRPTSGTVAYGDTSAEAGGASLRARIGMLGHDLYLYQELTAAENLRFTCALHGIDPSLVPSALERVGLAGTADERVGGFSQGMRQRLAIARTMLRQAELLLLDEPYAGLDGHAREVVDEAVLAARDTGRTVVLATHEATRADLATRTVLIEAGRLQHPQPVSPARSAVPR